MLYLQSQLPLNPSCRLNSYHCLPAAALTTTLYVPTGVLAAVVSVVPLTLKYDTAVPELFFWLFTE